MKNRSVRLCMTMTCLSCFTGVALAATFVAPPPMPTEAATKAELKQEPKPEAKVQSKVEPKLELKSEPKSEAKQLYVQDPKLEPIPEPIASSSAAAGDSEVTVIKRGADRIEEFRAKGRLYMVRVYPAIGLPYTLIDEKGDGVFNRKDPRGTPITPAQWKVLSW